jgi:hypothetical protein
MPNMQLVDAEKYAANLKDYGVDHITDLYGLDMQDLQMKEIGMKKLHIKKLMQHLRAGIDASMPSNGPTALLKATGAQVAAESVPNSTTKKRQTDFKSSHFKAAYSQVVVKRHYHGRLITAAQAIVEQYCTKHNLTEEDDSDDPAISFVLQLQSEYELQADTVPTAAQRMWTSNKKLGGPESAWPAGVEFCSILNTMIREDCPIVASHTAFFSKALNMTLTVARGKCAEVPFPPNGATWRGGGFWDCGMTREFFVEGKRYRVPNPLATSFDQAVTEFFLERVKFFGCVNSKMLWKVEVDERGKDDNEFKCKHVNLVAAKTRSLAAKEKEEGSEQEYLYAAYSPFVVKEVVWSSDTQIPHRITLLAAIDGKDPQWPEDLPLAPWT